MHIVFGDMLRAASYLSKKDNKTPEEESALKAFNKSMKIAFGIAILFAILIGIWVFNFTFALPYGDKVYGTVEGDEVRYRISDVSYISLAELNIESSEVNEGDRIIMWVNYNDETIKEAKAEKDHNFGIELRLWILVFMIVTFTVTAVVISKLLHKKIGVEFYDWYYNEYETR